MGLDIRLPIGLMFSVLGLTLAAYGLVTKFTRPKIYEKSLWINVNLWWGLAIFAFGAIMLLLTWRSAKKPPAESR